MLNFGPFMAFLYISYIGNNKNPPITDEIYLSLDATVCTVGQNQVILRHFHFLVIISRFKKNRQPEGKVSTSLLPIQASTATNHIRVLLLPTCLNAALAPTSHTLMALWSPKASTPMSPSDMPAASLADWKSGCVMADSCWLLIHACYWFMLVSLSGKYLLWFPHHDRHHLVKRFIFKVNTISKNLMNVSMTTWR